MTVPVRPQSTDPDPAERPPEALRVLISGLPSDAHTWNLVFLQKYIEEYGHHTRNLGPCVPEQLLVQECVSYAPDIVVISTANGHGLRDGLRAIAALRERPELAAVPVVIGGKLTTTGPLTAGELRQLEAAGFGGVFDGGSLPDFQAALTTLASERHAIGGRD